MARCLGQTLQHCKTLPREHLIGYQGFKMFLLKDHFFFSHNLGFVIIQVLSQLDFFLVCSQFDFLVLSQFEFILVFSQCEF